MSGVARRSMLALPLLAALPLPPPPASATGRRRAPRIRQLWAVPGANTPYVGGDDEHVVEYFNDSVTCYDVATGKVRWRRPNAEGEDFAGIKVGSGAVLFSVSANGQSPCLLQLLDIGTGEVRWARHVDRPGPWAPATVAVARSGVLGVEGSVLQARSFGDGSPLWSRRDTGGHSGLVVDDATLVSRSRGTELVDLATGQARWAVRPGTFAAPVVSPDGGYLTGYGDLGGVSPTIHRIDCRTGRQVWSGGSVPFYPAMYLDEGEGVVVVAKGGELTACEASTGKQLWRRQVHETDSLDSVAVAAGTVWAAHQNALGVYYLASGQPVMETSGSYWKASRIGEHVLVRTSTETQLWSVTTDRESK